jgi:hypothetical protein
VYGGVWKTIAQWPFKTALEQLRSGGWSPLRETVLRKIKPAKKQQSTFLDRHNVTFHLCHDMPEVPHRTSRTAP